MIDIKSKMQGVVLILIFLSLAACANNRAHVVNSHSDSQSAFDYLKELEGKWVVKGGDEGPFGWEFEVTSRGTVIVERLKVGTPTEMMTVYHLENNTLIGDHYCQLGNQPHLTAVNTHEGDLNFLCNGNVSSTESHAELHMHGVHFKKNGDSLVIWMDMYKNNENAFQTSYTLLRTSQ